MEELKKHFDPDEMTPEERMERIVELLAGAAFKLSLNEEKKEAEPTTSTTPAQALTLPLPPAKGRIPFGQKISVEGREVNNVEAGWIRRIKELATDGFSSEKIAKQLNQEDHESKRAGKWSRTAVWRILRKTKDKGGTK